MGRRAYHGPPRRFRRRATSIAAAQASDFDGRIDAVEHTVDSRTDTAGACSLELARPCIRLCAEHRAESVFWEVRFSDPQRVHDALADIDRGRVSNL